MHRVALLDAGGDQVAHHLVLAVDGDRAAARQRRQVDAVPLAREQQLDAVMHQPLAAHALAEPGFVERVDGALLQHAGADPVLAILARARLDQHRVDALQAKKMGKQQPGGAGADNRDLGTHCSSPEH